MQAQAQPLAIKAISTPAAFFLPLPLFPMNKVMMETVPQLLLHLGWFVLFWLLLSNSEKQTESSSQMNVANLRVTPQAQKMCVAKCY